MFFRSIMLINEIHLCLDQYNPIKEDSMIESED